MGRDYGAIFGEASQDLWKVLIDTAEAEAYDKIKTKRSLRGKESSSMEQFTDGSRTYRDLVLRSKPGY